MEVARKAMEEAQDSANSEEKSSAGDKYETGRAMSQNQKDLNQRQLLEAESALHMLEASLVKRNADRVGPGSLVLTSDKPYFIGPGLGLLRLSDGTGFVSVSVQAPAGKLLEGKKAGDSFEFMGKRIEILEIV